MTVDEAMRGRRTIRRFTDEPVSATDVREMLHLATLAPNIANRQMWRFVVVTNPALREMLARLVERKLDEVTAWARQVNQEPRLRVMRERMQSLSDAPVLIFVVNQGYRSGIEPLLVEQGGMKNWEIANQLGHPDLQSIGAMLGYLTLAAQDRGYGASWMTDPLLAARDIHRALDLRFDEDLAAIVALGHPAESPLPRPRRAIDEVITWRA
jgi:nitroreductase